MKKRILTLLLALLMLAALPAAAFAASPISVTVNGTAVKWTDATPYVDKNSRTMVPLRAVGEALGLTVSWNGAAREAIFGTVTMDTAAVVSKGRTYAPVRYLAEYFGYTVSWNGSNKTVGITGGAQPRWVLVGSSYQKASDTKNQYYTVTITNEGVKNGMVWFKRSGGYYQDPKNYALCDAWFGCQEPPATLTPGQSLTLEMRFRTENFEFASSTGSAPAIMLGANWITDGGYFLDTSGEKYLNTKNHSSGGTSGNIQKSGKYTKTVSNSTTIGAKYEITYCSNTVGTYTWTYELRK